MSAWVAIVPLAIALALLLAGPRWRGALPVVLALGLGLAGYAAVGAPGQPARPTPPAQPDPQAVAARQAAAQALEQDLRNVGQWMRLSQALIAEGRPREAVRLMETALKLDDRNPEFWVGLGNALVAQAGGEVVPAARLAFGRANAVDPTHPAPRYYLGLALLQAARPAEARKVWEELRADSKDSDPWVPDLDRKIAATRTMELLGVGRMQAPGAAPAPGGAAAGASGAGAMLPAPSAPGAPGAD
jgi:cytochrome c-type biogenesis protein CcmH/NrfG